MVGNLGAHKLFSPISGHGFDNQMFLMKKERVSKKDINLSFIHIKKENVYVKTNCLTKLYVNKVLTCTGCVKMLKFWASRIVILLKLTVYGPLGNCCCLKNHLFFAQHFTAM